MKKLILKGKVDTVYQDGWNKIVLVQEDGYKLDLISRFCELSLNANSIQVNYFLSESELTEQQLKENLILSISGGLTAEYEKYDYSYSSWTHCTDYNNILRVDKHDLNIELVGKNGMYALFEINYQPNEATE